MTTFHNFILKKKPVETLVLSQIHKQGNPGRPVISSVNCHTSNISKYVDYHLQPIVQQIPYLIYKIQVTFCKKSANRKNTR